MPAYHFLSIGLDDIDSLSGGCTTHFTTIVVRKLYKYGGFLLDYPRLIRLNPDIPWKTRGNGSVALDLAIQKKFTKNFLKEIKHALIKYIYEEDSSPASTQPALVIVDVSKLKQADIIELYRYSRNAKYRLITQNETWELINKLSHIFIDIYTPTGKRGLVGALTAIGDPLIHDYTYELLVYRSLKNKGKRFKDDDYKGLYKLLKLVDDEYSFAHIDYETRKVLVTPAGPDPVIMGIRGEYPSKVYSIFRKILRYIPFNYESWLIYVTNQGTNEHLYNSVNDHGHFLYSQTLRRVRIREDPKSEVGSHFYLDNILLENRLGRIYAYYETGRLREVFSLLKKHDYIEIGGGLKPYKNHEYEYVLNIEYMHILSKNLRDSRRPKCPKCYIGMTSLGREKGFRCKKCGYRIDASLSNIHIRRVNTPDIILPPLRSIKHLSKPLKRYGREKRYRIRGLRNIRYMWLNES